MASRTRILGLAFVLILVVLVGNGLLVLNNLKEIRRHETALSVTKNIVLELELVVSEMKDTETGMRGYLLTRSPGYLEPYSQAVREVGLHMDRLLEITAGDEDLSVHARVIDSVTKEKLRDLENNIKDFNRGLSPAQLREGLDSGKASMDHLRAQVRQMRERVEGQLETRRAQVERSMTEARQSFVFALSLNVFLATTAYFFLRRYLKNLGEQAWQKAALAELNLAIGGESRAEGLARSVLDFFRAKLDCPVGGFYVLQDGFLTLAGGLALSETRAQRTFALGEGLVGDAAARQRDVRLPDARYARDLAVHSSVVSFHPREVLVLPLVFERVTLGAIELGLTEDLKPAEAALLPMIKDAVAIALQSVLTRAHQQRMLETTQMQAEELQAQQEELRSSNEELERRANALRQSQERLQTQQEELRQTNEELEQQSRALDLQRNLLAERNVELQAAKGDLEAKAYALERASQYKSEFLANMSHELRTPLNSLLILATLLAENAGGNLTLEQIEFAKTISASGNELLALINDVLDLAKVESGKIDLHDELIDLAEFARALEKGFLPLARRKGLALNIDIADGIPPTIVSDRLRLEQIVKNLLSNAVKFTDKGSVTLTVRRVAPDEAISVDALAAATASPADLGHVGHVGHIAFVVTDTGIGIPEEKRDAVFNAFEQVDGAITRKYGGTGLGLAISRELTQLLCGSITVESEVGKGSRFTLRVPIERDSAVLRESQDDASVDVPQDRSFSVAAHERSSRTTSRTGAGGDGGPSVQRGAGAGAGAGEPGLPVESKPPHRREAARAKVVGALEAAASQDKVVLIVEDDARFASLLSKLALDSGFTAITVPDGESALDALSIRLPDAVILDIRLPGISGLAVLERLKADPRTRHIPTHVVSGMEQSLNALRMGAMGYLVKPASTDKLRDAFARIESVISKDVSRVLVVEDDAVQRESVCRLVAGKGIATVAVGRGDEALAALRTQTFDCMILDLKLPDMSGFDLLAHMDKDDESSHPPVVVYTGKDLTREEEARLRKHSESIILKGARSPERLLDEVSLFLHRVEADFTPAGRALLKSAQRADRALEGRKILLADDDLRNAFALLSALEPKGLKVFVARNGREALRMLDKEPDVSLVLMDIMMPEMDGYEAMRNIRAHPEHAKLPIIALTAKAMKGDREKCLEAGATDYLSKPIVLEHLWSMLRVWLPPKDGI